MKNMTEFLNWVKENNFSQSDIESWLEISNSLHGKTPQFYQLLGQWCKVAENISQSLLDKEKRA
jgi:hypothetical protein